VYCNKLSIYLSTLELFLFFLYLILLISMLLLYTSLYKSYSFPKSLLTTVSSLDIKVSSSLTSLVLDAFFFSLDAVATAVFLVNCFLVFLFSFLALFLLGQYLNMCLGFLQLKYLPSSFSFSYSSLESC